MTGYVEALLLGLFVCYNIIITLTLNKLVKFFLIFYFDVYGFSQLFSTTIRISTTQLNNLIISFHTLQPYKHIMSISSHFIILDVMTFNLYEMLKLIFRGLAMNKGYMLSLL